YLADGGAHAVSVLDPAAGQVITDIPVDTDPQALALSQDGTRLYVTGPSTATVTAIDTATGTVAATSPVGRNPAGVALSRLALPAPVVISISPASGPPSGGTEITLTGSHLKDATAVTFGPGHPATDVTCTDTSCTAVAPPADAGTVDVQVTTPAGTSAAGDTSRFTYAAADLGVTLAADPQPGLLGGRITYTLTITDHGPSALGAATVTAVLPAPMRASSGDCQTAGTTVTCGVTGLAIGASTTRRFTVPIGLLGVGLPYTVTASRTASTPVDLATGNDRAASTCTVVTSLIIGCR
ncbi:40-residue YVTN family beta-propeller repeat-containing protein, partial [Actinacidiphila rubida]